MLWCSQDIIFFLTQKLAIAAYPLPCLNGCFCYYSINDEANTVNCSHKNITQLPNAILPDTEQLIMAGNHLNELTFVSKDLTDTKIVDLQHCNIHEISSTALPLLLMHTHTLKMSHNMLTKVPSLLHTTHFQTKLWLANNQFECNCDMMWMRDWLLNATNVMDKENILCFGGPWNGNSN